MSMRVSICFSTTREVIQSQASPKPRFPSNPLIIRVPFFLLFTFNKETPK